MKYTYSCGLKNGKIIYGSIEANSKQEAVQLLTNKEYVVLSIKKNTSNFQKRFNNKFVIIFTKTFSSLIKAGLSINEILEIIYSQTEEKNEKNILEDLIKDIRSGISLANSLKKYPYYFNEHYCVIVEAGEKSGYLYETFNNLYKYLLYKKNMNRKILVSLTYPIFLFVFSLLVILFLSIFVLPSFAKIYDSFDKDLPFITSIILSFSKVIKDYWYILILVSIFLFFLITNFLKNELKKEKIDSLLLKQKQLKNFIYIKNINSFFTVLALALKSGMDIISALNVSNKTISNIKIKKDLNTAIINVIKGERLSRALNNINFPLMAVQMINAGENSNELEEMLNEIVELYQHELEQILSLFINFLEPILIIFIGIIIGTIIIAIILPILKLSSIVS